MCIGENGGTTAADLGLRSLHLNSPLTQLNNGCGIHTAAGLPDILVTDRAGNTADVNLDGAQTVQDVINAINAACVLAGVFVTADLTAVGNGIELTDTSGGLGELSVTTHPQNHSGYFTARELGLDQSVAANTLTGTDVNPAAPTGLFTHLLQLRDALLQNDEQTISEMAELIETDRQMVSTMRGQAGARARALQDRKLQMEDNVLAMKTLRSDLADVDFTEAITRYQNLYAALQGNLMTGQQLTNVSLLDFLT
jgi:flagellin-like hook-associated protein FlgL